MDQPSLIGASASLLAEDTYRNKHVFAREDFG